MRFINLAIRFLNRFCRVGGNDLGIVRNAFFCVTVLSNNPHRYKDNNFCLILQNSIKKQRFFVPDGSIPPENTPCSDFNGIHRPKTTPGRPFGSVPLVVKSSFPAFAPFVRCRFLSARKTLFVVV